MIAANNGSLAPTEQTAGRDRGHYRCRPGRRLRAGHHEVSALAGPKIPAHSLAACVGAAKRSWFGPPKLGGTARP